MWLSYLLIVIMIIMESPRETNKTSEGAIKWINTWITDTAEKSEQHPPFGSRRDRRTPRIGWRPTPRGIRSTRPLPLLMMAALAMHSTIAGSAGMASFDTNTYKTGIDNRASVCISHKASNFEGPLMDSPSVIKGIVGTRVTKIKQETLQW